MKRLVIHPLPYVVWAALVVVALWASYLGHPYVFAFTTLGLAWLTGAVSLVGIATCLIAKRPRLRDRAIIAAALAVAVATIVKALATLGSFNWA